MQVDGISEGLRLTELVTTVLNYQPALQCGDCSGLSSHTVGVKLKYTLLHVHNYAFV